MLRYPLIRRLVPFAKRRTSQHGKRIHFGITTNGTVLSREILEFWKRWGLGFHTSIDGCPEVQDRHRYFKNGRASSGLLEKNLPEILKLRPGTTARATVLPDTVHLLIKSYSYLRQLGYTDIALVPAAYECWNDADVAILDQQYRLIADELVQSFRQGEYIRVKYFDEGFAKLAKGEKSSVGHPCGVGRGMVLIDIHGDIWPCHRWSKEQQRDDWRLGSIFEPGFNYSARDVFEKGPSEEQRRVCLACESHYNVPGRLSRRELGGDGLAVSSTRKGV